MKVKAQGPPKFRTQIKHLPMLWLFLKIIYLIHCTAHSQRKWSMQEIRHWVRTSKNIKIIEPDQQRLHILELSDTDYKTTICTKSKKKEKPSLKFQEETE